MTLEEKILRVANNKAIVSEKNAENKDLQEEILNEMLRKNLDQLIVEIPHSEDYIVVKIGKNKKKTLDKTALASVVEVPKEELDSYGISKLTKDGVITPQLVKDHTRVEYVKRAKVNRKKPKKGGKK